MSIIKNILKTKKKIHCSHLVCYLDFWIVSFVEVGTEKLLTEVAQMSLISFFNYIQNSKCTRGHLKHIHP